MVGLNVELAAQRLAAALGSPVVSVRLAAALHAGSQPLREYVGALVDRCAVEPDFFVRDMLSWALIRNDHAVVVQRLLAELTSATPRARSQALHTLSKIGGPEIWPAITSDLLFDVDDEVARTAWRVAAVVVPAGESQRLARALSTQLGRGGRDVRLSLSRALAALGEVAIPVLAQAESSTAGDVRSHAAETLRLIADPEAGFGGAVEDAKRARSLRGAPLVGGLARC